MLPNYVGNHSQKRAEEIAFLRRAIAQTDAAILRVIDTGESVSVSGGVTSSIKIDALRKQLSSYKRRLIYAECGDTRTRPNFISPEFYGDAQI